jgi:hypothetical protein
MDKTTAFDRFAPAILQVYHRNKEAFWSAVMAPFLANKVSMWDWFRHLRVDVGLLSAFRGLDDAARQTLKDFSAPLGLDVTAWQSNRLQYFKDAYPVFAFLAVWLDEEGLHELVDQFADILRAGVFAVAGYGILDENVDSDAPSPVEILTAQALLALGLIGIAMCTLSGIGPTQSALGWTHPVTIIGSILGVLALLMVVLPLLGVQLPLIADTRSAVLALAVIMLVKVGLMGVERFIA